MKKKYWIIIVILIIGAFYGGMRYASASSASPAGHNFSGASGDFPRGQMQAGETGGQNSSLAARGQGGSMIRGEILSADDTSITVKTEANGSKIIMLSDKTEITETVAVPKENLTTGKTVMVSGETNGDGTVSAGTIFIREMPPVSEKQQEEK